MSDMVRERLERVRREQATRAPLSDEQVEALFRAHVDAHSEHPWHRVGRCVYCGPCGVRLYQGTMPDDHPRWSPRRRPTEADRMRERWGK